jgi:hypothetical protein
LRGKCYDVRTPFLPWSTIVAESKRDPSEDIQLAFIIGAGTALYLLLPSALKSAAHLGAIVGLLAGLAAALGRRKLAAEKPPWLRTLLPIPLFIVGAALGFVAMTWLGSHLPGWIDAVRHLGGD